jgi:hypothetical protein
VAVTATVILALALFLYVPFIEESSLGPVQLPCYFAGTCNPGYVHFTISLSCYLSGDSPTNFVSEFRLGDSYSPQVNHGELFYGCGGPQLT